MALILTILLMIVVFVVIFTGLSFIHPVLGWIYAGYFCINAFRSVVLGLPAIGY